MPLSDYEARLAELERRQGVLFEMVADNAEALKAVRDILVDIRAAVIEQHKTDTDESR